MIRPPQSHHLHSKAHAFSLLELLVVACIGAMMMSMALPSVTSLKGSNDTTAMYSGLEKIIEGGRAQAMALGTHVWIGFSEVTVNGVRRLDVTAFASQDGTNDGSAGNLRQLWKVSGFSGVRLGSDTDLQNLASSYQSLVSGTVGVPGSVTAALAVNSAGALRNFTDTAIQFSPRGEVVNAPQAWVGVPLIPVRGVSQDQRSQSGCLLISKASGAITVVRL